MNRYFLLCALFLATISLQANDKLLEAFSKSYLYESQGKLILAISTLEDVYNASNYSLNLRLGWLYYSNQQYSMSINHYQKAIDLMPNAIEARFGYVLPASAVQNWTDVMNQYKTILAVDPNNTLANYRLGYMYYLRDEFSTAKQYIGKVVKLYPFDFDSVNLLGWIHLKLGENDKAREFLNRARIIDPTNDSPTDGLALLK